MNEYSEKLTDEEVDEVIRIRKLTPCETFRLMGFNDSDYDKAKEINSNTQMYKQCGNSIVVSCLMSLFMQLGITDKRWNDLTEEERKELVSSTCAVKNH